MTWPTLTLGELTATTRPICYGVLKPGPYVQDGVPLLRIVDMPGDVVAQSGYHRISSALDSEFHRSRLRGGEVLLSIQGTVGRVAIAPIAVAGANISRTIAVIEPDSRLEPRFLRLYLMSRTAGSGFQTTGTTRASLNISVIRAMPVPVPPLDEQRRIVDLLEDHLSRLDAADAYLEAAQRRGNRLHDGLLDSELAAVESADVPLAELLTVGLSNGKSVPTQEGGFPVLRLTALRDGRIDVAERKPGRWTASEASRFLVARGDFLIARGNGSLRLVGRGGLVTDDPDAVAFPDTLIRARPDHSRIDPEYMAYVWNAPGIRRQIEKSARTTAGIYKVNQKDLSAVQVPVPSIVDQKRVAAAVRKSRDALSQVSVEIGRAVARSSALRRSLLAAAFSGRLTSEFPTPRDLEEPSR